MGFRSLPVVLVCVVASSAHAVVPRRLATRVAADQLTAMPAAKSKPLRTHAEYRQGPTQSKPWLHFAAKAGGRWDVSWDAATGVPSRIWGSGMLVPGSSASPAIAEQVARQLLADHLALLAPGAAISDFTLVSNHWDGEIRSIGFVQRFGGKRIVGGQVSFRFKHDRLFVIGSEALPNVKLPPATARMMKTNLAVRARSAVRAELYLPDAPVTEPGEDVIVPFVGDSAVLGYRLATPVTIDGGADGRYLAYVDPSSAAVLAVHQLNTYATGTVKYRGVDRYPEKPRIDRIAPRAQVTVDGAIETTTMEGLISWSPDANKTLTLSVKGDLVSVVNKANADGTTVTHDMAIAPNGEVVWDATANPEDDAQLITYIATNQVKEFVRAHIDANLPKIDAPMTANVNINQDCNAYYDGKAINFFHASAQCENTGRIEDVVFHEFGHNVHTVEIIDGVGDFDPAMSEGAADFLAASITGDHGMGRGFFYNDEALRDLDPDGSEHIFPRDVGEIHTTGLIYGGTFWDLRKTLIAQYGADAGAALTLKIYLGTLRRATSIPTSLIEALAVDDDDGDLANGTPNECAIRAAFGRHGMRTATGVLEAPGTLDFNALSTTVRIRVTGLSDRCSGDEVVSATTKWRPGYLGVPVAGEVLATRTGDASFYAAIPLAQDEAVFYSTDLRFEDGTTLTLADNLGDPEYQLYQGHTIPLYCTSFDKNPFSEGWKTGNADGTPSPWEWAIPGGGTTDPQQPFTGTHALMQSPGGDYPAMASSWVTLPKVDVGAYSDVRLQYRRWLAVEDSHYDTARITVNGVRAWQNTSAHNGDDSSLHHIDREWRFHDVPLSGFLTGRSLEVGFDLTSDPGLQLGGWAIDDLCIVANARAVCGDGIKTPTEGCDDGLGNADLPNHCRTFCRAPACGDSIIDDNEACDDGPDGSPDCNKKCESLIDDGAGGCGCTSSGSPATLVFGVGVGLLVLRRRRRS